MPSFSTPVVLLCIGLLVVGCDKSNPEGGALPPIGGGPAGGGAAKQPASSEGGEPVSVPAVGDGDDGKGTRTPAVAADDPLFDRLEGAGMNNACERDRECFVGGCSGEVCSAQTDVNTTCDVVVTKLSAAAKCGCVASECRWYEPLAKPMSGAGSGVDPTPPSINAGEPPPSPIETCGGETCKPGYSCVEYFGIAGSRGPKFQSCEIRCKRGAVSSCPDGLSCVTIADGPGSVCR